jgi:hypothetical protein
MGTTVSNHVSQQMLDKVNAKIDQLLASGKLPLRLSSYGADEGYGLRMLVTDSYGNEQDWGTALTWTF